MSAPCSSTPFLCLMTCLQSICCFWVGPFSRAAFQGGSRFFLALSLPAAFDVQKAVVAGLACGLPAGVHSLLPVRALPGRLVAAWCQAGHAQHKMLHQRHPVFRVHSAELRTVLEAVEVSGA